MAILLFTSDPIRGGQKENNPQIAQAAKSNIKSFYPAAFKIPDKQSKGVSDKVTIANTNNVTSDQTTRIYAR